MLDNPEICVVEYTRQEVELLHNAEALSLCCHVPLEFLLTSLHLTFNGTATSVWIAVTSKQRYRENATTSPQDLRVHPLTLLPAEF